jgi:outer membrane protein OmpA-like peptidoglycan-associated protein
MKAHRYFGIALVVLAVIVAVGLDWVGRDHQPRDYTVGFARGTELSAAGERRIQQIAAAMARQPAYRAVIVGHTGTRGDPDANLTLGRERADAVAAALRDADIDTGRLETRSAGAEAPLPRREDESERGYQSRLSRAEVRLIP